MKYWKKVLVEAEELDPKEVERLAIKYNLPPEKQREALCRRCMYNGQAFTFAGELKFRCWYGADDHPRCVEETPRVCEFFEEP